MPQPRHSAPLAFVAAPLRSRCCALRAAPLCTCDGGCGGVAASSQSFGALLACAVSSLPQQRGCAGDCCRGGAPGSFFVGFGTAVESVSRRVGPLLLAGRARAGPEPPRTQQQRGRGVSCACSAAGGVCRRRRGGAAARAAPAPPTLRAAQAAQRARRRGGAAQHQPDPKGAASQTPERLPPLSVSRPHPHTSLTLLPRWWTQSETCLTWPTSLSSRWPSVRERLA